MSWDVAAALRGGVVDRHHAWDFVRHFAAGWTAAPLRADDGVAEAELRAVERELGHRLPAALREGYALFGRRRDDLTGGQDPLVPPTGLFVDAGPGGHDSTVLVFRRENQDCAAWGIPLDRIARIEQTERIEQTDQDDPPVVVGSVGVGSRYDWVPYLDQMSVAWVELVLSAYLFGAGPLYDACELPEALVPRLLAGYRRVDLPDHPMWTGAEESPVRWYAAPGCLLRRDGVVNHSWLHVRARTAADLDAVRAALPGAWVG
ncbi:SMI1/KNR4 family protein [Streptomyces sp. NPDC048483]|uniref:SMI1/KNR4 family protein n=1 Tax=Streptomyces sp. NPDC048483 TaxID=3154927 RepID=UPI003430BBF0